MEADDETARQMEEQKRIIALSDQKKNKLLELVTMGAITTANFKSMTAVCDREAEEAQKNITELEQQMFSKEEYRKHIGEIRARLDAAIRDASTGVITTEFVAQYIDKILVTLTDDDTAKLEIKIFTGKSTEKWLQKLEARSKGRTGVMSKKMVESYENSVKNTTNG
jgi:hypothetical protein